MDFFVHVWSVIQSCLTVTMDTGPARLLSLWNFPGKKIPLEGVVIPPLGDLPDSGI